MQAQLTPELRALAAQSFQHQAAGRFAEAAQGYAAVLAREPDLWTACYNLGLVYQHLGRMAEAAQMYRRAVQLNPQLAEGYNNLGNVLKAQNHDAAAIDAYRRALGLNAQLADAGYNLGMMLQARGDAASAVELFRQAVAGNALHQSAWEALYSGLVGLDRHEEAIAAFYAWNDATPPSPERVAAGLALGRTIGDRALEARYLALALDWPFAEFTPEQFAPVPGMLAYFDVTREQQLAAHRRYDAAVMARHPAVIPMLPRRAAGERLRIGYLSADFRQQTMGRWLLEVIARHDRSRVSIFLVSACAPRDDDAVTAALRGHADGFADISALDDYAAARSIAEADLDILVDLAGHSAGARPGIYAHRPARNIVTHPGELGCLGLGAVDYALTDRIADLSDAAHFQIERPFALDVCVLPLLPMASGAGAVPVGAVPDLAGKFVFAAFAHEFNLSTHCLALWRRVLEALPEAVLLFAPPTPARRAGIERLVAAAGIGRARIAFLTAADQDAPARAFYRSVHAVLDTLPHAGGATTLAALHMGVPVVTLAGERHTERIGTSILTHVNVAGTIAGNEDEFVAIAVKLARDEVFMAQTRQRIETAVAATDGQAYTRALEQAYSEIAARKPVTQSMTLTARQFFQALRNALQRHRNASNDAEREAVAASYQALRAEQPDYPPLLRAEGELAQTMGNLPLASECANALLRQFPDDLEVRLSSAGFLIDDGAAADALEVLPPVAGEGGDGVSDVRVHVLYMRAHAKLGQWETALRYSAPAVVLAPADVQVLFWHGLVLSHAGDAEAALTFLNRALILAPDHVEAAYNAGVILAELGNARDAETVFRRVLAAPAARAPGPAPVSAHLRLLHLLWKQGRYDEWMREGRRFIDTYPDLERSQLIEARIARLHGQVDGENEILLPLAEAATVLKDHGDAYELIGEMLATLSYHDVAAQLLRRLRTRYRDAARVLYRQPSRPPGETPTPAPATDNAPLRVGYLVDFSLPFVADFISLLAVHRDPQRMTVKVYAVSPVESAVRETLLAAGIQLMSLAAFDERRAAQSIQADKLDILVDAGAFGQYARPGVLSYRPARIQLALPGLVHPSGIGELDYRLSDRVADLNAAAVSVSRDAVFLEGCVYPLLPAAQVPSPPTRRQLGVEDNVPVFGVLASAMRLSSRCLTTWKALADRVPAARFLVGPLEATDRDTIVKLLGVAGIGPARVLMLPASHPRTRDLSLAGLVDVILDTMPASDYFSTRAAILDSIPLVTLSGGMPEERVALSLLSHLGDTSTVAATGRDYVDLAANLARDPQARADRAARLRDLREQSGIADMHRYVACFEDALLRAASLAPLELAS